MQNNIEERIMETLTVGKIVNTHGIKGELRIVPSTDDVNRFKKFESIYIDCKGLREYNIEGVRFHKKFVLIKFKGVNSIEEGEIFKNCFVKIDKQTAEPLDDDEYYINDLYGLSVNTEDGRFLGVLDDVLFGKANDVYVVEREDGQKAPLLIPAIKSCVLNIDIEEGVMTVRLLKGLEEV